MKAKRYLTLGSVILCCAGFLAWYTNVSGTTNSADEQQAALSITRPIPTTLVEQAGFEQVRLFPGTVKARDSVKLAFSVEGLLTELNAREGKRVKQGEILARLDERDFRNARDGAKASYLRAQADFKRAKALFDRQVISQAEYDAAKTTSDVALAEYNIRQKALDDTVIRAPFDGIIAKRYVENREHVKKQASILALKDISEIEINFQVPERLMANNGIAGFHDIRARFDIAPAHWFPGEIKEYSVQSDPATRTYGVAIRLQSPADLEVLPGMTATVSAAVGKSNNVESPVALVPVESVLSGTDGKSYAWIIPETGGNPQKVELTLGAMRNDHIEVTGGLTPGLRIATAGIHTLSEGMLVRPMKNDGEGLDG